MIEIRDLLEVEQNQNRFDWKPFREGVDIHRIYGDGLAGPSAALIRFRKAARIPWHCHEGYEHILVLAGSQRDQNGRIVAGALRVHAPGSSHWVDGEEGCVVLAIYEKPVRFDHDAAD
ncbi:MAG TPA: cupin domain-containing protein [Verrucomicrobiaceae bacterium]